MIHGVLGSCAFTGCAHIKRHNFLSNVMSQGSLEVKLPTIWIDGNRGGRSQRGEEKKREDQRRESQKKEDAGARKGRKVPVHCVFPVICGSGGSKSRLAKAAGAEPFGQMTDEKVHAVVAQSTFPSQTAQSTPCSDHFWKLRCQQKCAPLRCEAHRKKLTVSGHFWKLRYGKSARLCCVKHISKSKVLRN